VWGLVSVKRTLVLAQLNCKFSLRLLFDNTYIALGYKRRWYTTGKACVSPFWKREGISITYEIHYKLLNSHQKGGRMEKNCQWFSSLYQCSLCRSFILSSFVGIGAHCGVTIIYSILLILDSGHIRV